MLDYGPRNIRISLADDELTSILVSLDHYVRSFGGGERIEQLFDRLSTVRRRKNKKYNDSLPPPQHHYGKVI
jgi:hypothetical protein